MKGMCQNSTRRVTWQNASGVNLSPIVGSRSVYSSIDEYLSIELTLAHNTHQEEYQIFDAFKAGNLSMVMDLIDLHLGVNAVDEWGQTPLMIACIQNYLQIVAALLNTRRPVVEVNLAKPSGYTALFYAVERAPVTIVQALLRRGADPNATLTQETSRGNTPLHYACLLEKPKVVESLLMYGANPVAKNEYGVTPLQLVPEEATTSVKLYIRKLIFEVGEFFFR